MANGLGEMLPDELAEIRRRYGLSIHDVATLCNMRGANASRTVRRWISGEQQIDGPPGLILRLIRDVPEVRRYLGLPD